MHLSVCFLSSFFFFPLVCVVFFSVQMSEAIESWFCTAYPKGVLDCKCLMQWTWVGFVCVCVCVCSMSRGTLWTAVSDAMHVREWSALQSSWWPMYLQRGMDRPALRQRWEPLVAVQSWQTEWICSFICWQIQGWNSEVNSPAVLMGERVRSSVAISPRTQKHLILRALIDRWWLVFVRR